MNLNYRNRIFTLLSIFVLIFGCGEKIPIKEMSLAKLEISHALTVRAKIYAPEEIKEAKKKLIESHQLVKEDALEKSKEAAILSCEKAKEAYNKSIPLLAKDTLDIAEKSLEEAVEAYAEVLAESEFKKAKEAFTNAGKLFEEKKYYLCYENAVEADINAKDARNTAIGKKNILSESINEVKATLEEAERYNASNYALDKVDTATDNIKIAEESLENLQLKKGFAAIENAAINADEAYLIALRETAKDKLESAENLHFEANDSEGAALARDELAGSKESYDLAKSLFEDSKYKESIETSAESERLSYIVLNAMKELAKEKMAGAEIVLIQARESEGAKIAPSKCKSANDAFVLSKSLYAESKYKESIAASEEAERLAYIVINTRKAEIEVKVVKKNVEIPESEKDYYTYKVRYIPNRRDCLWRIADRYYKNPLLWKTIYEVNRDKIYNPHLIWPDMILKVPKLDKEKSSNQKKKTSEKIDKEAIKPEAISEDTLTEDKVK